MADLSLAPGRKQIALNSSSFDVCKTASAFNSLFRFMIEEQFGWRVENCPNAVRILDTEDLHCLRLNDKKHKRKTEFKTCRFIT
jgi:hypothetical protein